MVRSPWLQCSFWIKHCICRVQLNIWDDTKCHSSFSLLGWNTLWWRKLHFLFRSGSQTVMAALQKHSFTQTHTHTHRWRQLLWCLPNCEIRHKTQSFSKPVMSAKGTKKYFLWDMASGFFKLINTNYFLAICKSDNIKIFHCKLESCMKILVKYFKFQS